MKVISNYGKVVFEDRCQQARDAVSPVPSKVELIEELLELPYFTPQGDPDLSSPAFALPVLETREPRKKKSEAIKVFSVLKPHLCSGNRPAETLAQAKALHGVNSKPKQSLLPTAAIFTGNATSGFPLMSTEEILDAVIALNTPDKPAMRVAGVAYTIIPELPPDLLAKFHALQKYVSKKQRNQYRVAKYRVKKGKVDPTNYGEFLANFTQYAGPMFKLQNLLCHYKAIADELKVRLEGSVLHEEHEDFEVEVDVLLQELAKQPRHFYVVRSDKKIECLFVDPLLFEIALKGDLKNILRGLQKVGMGFEAKSSDGFVFALKSERFLRFLNRPFLKEFIAIRTLYPPELIPLFMQYMIEKEKISPAIVEAAKAYGQWINQQARRSAREEAFPDKAALTPEDWNKVSALQAKRINELESGAANTSSADVLLRNLTTRAGRLSAGTPPEVASDFFSAALTGQISLEQTKNLALLFMRTTKKAEKKPEIATP